MRKTRDLIVEREFKDLIPPLSQDEYNELEKCIAERGFESSRGKIITWNNIIIDGHNRYEICKKLNIIPESVEVSRVNTREEAVLWIIQNQLGRRNLASEQISYLRGKQYETEKSIRGGNHGNQYTVAKAQNDTLPNGGDENLKTKATAKRLAEQHGVSPATIKREAKKAATIDAIGEVSPVAKQKILSGKSGITNKEIESLSGSSKESLEKVAEAIEDGTYKAKKCKTIPFPVPKKPKQPKPEEKVPQNKPKVDPDPFSQLTMMLLHLSSNESNIIGGSMVCIKNTMLGSDFISECEQEALKLFKARTESEIEVLTDILGKITLNIKETPEHDAQATKKDAGAF